MKPKEIWKPIMMKDTIPGSAFVSSYGRFMDDNNNLIPEYESTNGFKYVRLKLNYDKKNELNRDYQLYPSDEVIGRTFIPIPDYLKDKDVYIYHEDHNLHNNYVDNLKWIENVESWDILRHPRIRKNYYQISDRGRIRRLFEQDFILKEHIDGGYNRVSLAGTYSGERFSFGAHRLVAEHYVFGRTPERNTINHIDGNRSNNYWKNLEWVTTAENLKHAAYVKSIPYGDNSPVAILSTEDAARICVLLNKYNGSVEKVVNKLKPSIPYLKSNLVSSIKYGNTFKHVSDKLLDEHGKQIMDKHYDPETIRDMAYCLKENKGDVKKTKAQLTDKYPWVTYGYLWHLKDKSVASDITDEIFTKDEFPKALMITDDIAEEICKCLLKHKHEKYISDIVYKELKDLYPGLTKDHVRYIKDKRTFISVSDKYFQKGDI